MKLKVCGMKYSDNINEVVSLQPDYLGLIFWEHSKRYVQGTIPKLPANIKKVGVFVDADKEVIIDKVIQYNLQAVQLHGHETPEFCAQLKKDFQGISAKQLKINIIKVFSIRDHFNFSLLEPYEEVCDFYLFDTKGKLPGGNGYTFNWEVLKNYPSTKPYFLSGGIGPKEADSILEFLKRPEAEYCHVIDVNSKFELEPGLKDINKLMDFRKRLIEQG